MRRRGKPALERLEELRAAVREAEAKLAEVELERRKASRSLDRVVAPVRAYHEAVAAGEREADAALERRLTAAVTEVQSNGLVSAKPVLAHGKIIDLEVVDERIEAKIVGTQRLVQTRIEERNAFARDRAEELQAELLEKAQAAQEGLTGARAALEAAASEWSRVRGEFDRLIPLWDIAPGELPQHNPLGGALEAIGQAFAPMAGGQTRDPRRLTPAPRSLLEEVSDA
ncbi:MAG: hypothetical protein WKF33_07690 [Thermoleophilaceae bacterium]